MRPTCNDEVRFGYVTFTKYPFNGRVVALRIREITRGIRQSVLPRQIRFRFRVRDNNVCTYRQLHGQRDGVVVCVSYEENVRVCDRRFHQLKLFRLAFLRLLLFLLALFLFLFLHFLLLFLLLIMYRLHRRVRDVNAKCRSFRTVHVRVNSARFRKVLLVRREVLCPVVGHVIPTNELFCGGHVFLVGIRSFRWERHIYQDDRVRQGLLQDRPFNLRGALQRKGLLRDARRGVVQGMINVLAFCGHVCYRQICPNHVLTRTLFRKEGSSEIVGDCRFHQLKVNGVLINVLRNVGTVLTKDRSASERTSAAIHAPRPLGEGFNGDKINRVNVRASRRSFRQFGVNHVRCYANRDREIRAITHEREVRRVLRKVPLVVVLSNVAGVRYVDDVKFRYVLRDSSRLLPVELGFKLLRLQEKCCGLLVQLIGLSGFVRLGKGFVFVIVRYTKHKDAKGGAQEDLVVESSFGATRANAEVRYNDCNGAPRRPTRGQLRFDVTFAFWRTTGVGIVYRLTMYFAMFWSGGILSFSSVCRA